MYVRTEKRVVRAAPPPIPVHSFRGGLMGGAKDVCCQTVTLTFDCPLFHCIFLNSSFLMQKPNSEEHDLPIGRKKKKKKNSNSIFVFFVPINLKKSNRNIYHKIKISVTKKIRQEPRKWKNIPISRNVTKTKTTGSLEKGNSLASQMSASPSTLDSRRIRGR